MIVDDLFENVAGPEKCWPGYRKVGTKPGTGRNAGKRVNDCEKIKESSGEFGIGDPVIITGDVEFRGKTGDVREFDRDGSFVVVDLYNYGPYSFHTSDVSRNDYADAEDDEDVAESNDHSLKKVWDRYSKHLMAARGDHPDIRQINKSGAIVRNIRKYVKDHHGQKAVDDMERYAEKQQWNEGVAEAAGLYGPFTVTINTGERPTSRTKTKKFKREDDAILWAEDWFENSPQYVYATAEITDPQGNVVWYSDETMTEADTDRIADRYDPEEFDDMMLRLKTLAGAGPLKTVWDPQKRVYKNVPISQNKDRK